ncbi:polysaccharide deacetylase family protein [Bacillus litorisediminis]|uniref:polysaccharide deacetylase family protein n=1 Tax=Bacillus litorisediminis TaxID=2922713 RepID=UPI001FAC3FEA|nr:polysaccharide deacetylase family protein [Bacillus litorisediminis]
MSKKFVIFIGTVFILLLAACEAKVDQPRPEEVSENSEDESALDPNPSEQDDLISAIVAAAEAGIVEDAPFQIGKTNFQEIKAEWGEPDRVNQAGYGYYADYTEKGVTVGYIKEGPVFDLRSYSESLHSITYSMIEEALGEPDENRYYGTDQIYVYQLNEEFQLKFIIPQEEEGVHHISVFSEKTLDTTTQEYVLDIKGTSGHLPAETWENMLAWRKDIQVFAQGYGNMWLNGPDKPMVALTFDDGPDEENVTNSVIDILDQYGVKGTFFFVGENVEKYPDVVQKAAESGHLVLGHSYLHENLKSKNFQGVVEDLQKTEAAIEAVIGKAPALFRPPFGDTDLDVVNAAKQEGYNIILWSIDTIDWADGAVSEEIVENVASNIRNGDIILMHTSKERVETPKALPIIIEELQKRNFELVDVATLLELEPYK